MTKEDKKLENELARLEALRVLNIREEVFHPKRSWTRHWRSMGQLSFGLIMIFCFLIADGDSGKIMLLFGNISIVQGVIMWQQKESKDLHRRIDSLIKFQGLSQVSKNY